MNKDIKEKGEYVKEAFIPFTNLQKMIEVNPKLAEFFTIDTFKKDTPFFGKVKSMFKCMTWKKAVGWPTDKPTHDCCSTCHAEEHDMGRLRLINGATYRVCCGIANLCLKDLKKKWWCDTCIKDANPINYMGGVVCFTCNDVVASYNTLSINPLTEWCFSCNEKQQTLTDTTKPGYTKVVYCAKCKWPIMIQKEQTPTNPGKTPGYGGAYKKYMEEHMNNLVPKLETPASAMTTQYSAIKKMKLKELYGGNEEKL